MFNLQNRRYIGNKYKLLDWIFDNVEKNCEGDSVLDIFAGTGVVAERFLKSHKKVVLNDFLYSNEVIFNAFFNSNGADYEHLRSVAEKLSELSKQNKRQNYFDKHFGGKFFSKNDAREIGFIRERLEALLESKKLEKKEYYILLASLVYSIDHISNTVGHYDAYFKNKEIKDRFEYKLIQNLDTTSNDIEILREDANIVAETTTADIVFIDPPYNSRQYSRFYHILENLVEWKKPKLHGVALKPEAENMSDYSRSNAKVVFSDLIEKLDCKYLVVTYNNTFNSKSSSSQNKITLEEITDILKRKATTKVLSKSYRFFNSGKTEFKDHKEYLFITEVRHD
ncbi:MAG: adenine methyltransferase [Chloroflexi bacterium]|nr:adenine methyltransferase [Chloroflexota bacterium]|tara:strand:+ start:1667 stop:2683 length:1017 start_codon:yes stop_codon:yes gene_type:complete